MKELFWNRTTKLVLWSMAVGFSFGAFYGVAVNNDRVFKDCRYAGVVRIGEATFKCEQFSKVVLLTPDEIVAKDKKK
jgi:hypothetical protein